MRQLILVSLLVAGLAAVGSAAASAVLPVTISPPSFGGVVGTSGSSVTATSLVIKLGSLTFADISCSGSTCTGAVAGVPVILTKTVTSTGVVTFSSSAFPTHGAWVKAVADWAVDNRSALPAGVTAGRIVSQAARIEGPLASSGQAGGGGGHGHGRP